MIDNGTVQSLTGRPAAAATLARGGTPAEAARAAGVKPPTVSRWRRDPAFAADVAAFSEAAGRDVLAALTEASEALAAEAVASVRTLAALRDTATESPQVRRGAARDILDLALRLREHVALEERVADIEARLAEPNGRAP